MTCVYVELQQVQTWLFGVPRLRAMLGANSLLGETLRVALPKLARETGRWALTPSADAYPDADPNEPLKEHDDPAADAGDGIFARDGGHFEASCSNGAEEFAEVTARATPARRVAARPRGRQGPVSSMARTSDGLARVQIRQE